METFEWTPYCPPEVREGFRVVSSQYESGRSRRYYKGRSPRRWTLQFRARVQTMREIQDFYRDRKGPFEAFRWREPYGNELVTVHFADEALDIASQWKRSMETGLLEIVYGTFTLTIEEVL